MIFVVNHVELGFKDHEYIPGPSQPQCFLYCGKSRSWWSDEQAKLINRTGQKRFMDMIIGMKLDKGNFKY